MLKIDDRIENELKKLQGVYTFHENGKLKGIAHNMIVETGAELIADILVNDIANYTYGVYPQWLGVGDGTTPATVDDWELESEWSAGYGKNDENRCEITTSERQTGTSIGKFEGTIKSSASGTIAEVGAFLHDTGPTADPQGDSAQRRYTMLSRALLTTPYVKSAGSETLITYRVTV